MENCTLARLLLREDLALFFSRNSLAVPLQPHLLIGPSTVSFDWLLIGFGLKNCIFGGKFSELPLIYDNLYVQCKES